MSNYWHENSKRNLFAQSENKSDFNTARGEWVVTGKVFDNCGVEEDPQDISCELCEHEQLRWQFEIRNEINKNVMLVGSSCIEKFDINYYRNGKLLSAEERNSILDRQIRKIREDHKYEAGLDALRALYKVDEKERDTITMIGKKFKRVRKLDPGMAIYISRMLEKSGIDYLHSWFQIALRNDLSQKSIRSMSDSDYERLEPFLSKQQKDKCEKIREKFKNYRR